MSNRQERRDREDRREQKESTLSALLKKKRKRGRPPRKISRQNVYVELAETQKRQLSDLAACLPDGFARADVADLAIMVLATRMEGLRRAVAGRSREIPEGITDMESMFLLWDLVLPEDGETAKWTSIRVSPQQAIDLGRIHGTLNVLFGATRSDVFGLALALLAYYIENDMTAPQLAAVDDLVEMRDLFTDIYL